MTDNSSSASLDDALLLSAQTELDTFMSLCKLPDANEDAETLIAIRLSRTAIATVCQIAKANPTQLSPTNRHQLDEIGEMLDKANQQFDERVRSGTANSLVQAIWTG